MPQPLNVPKGEAYDPNRDCRALDCAAAAIQRYARYLAEPAVGSREKERKALVLRFLAHVVGDLHQPLHVGNVEDLGGNRIPVRWFSSSAGGMNLHKVWDSAILRRAGVTTIADARALNDEIAVSDASAWATFDVEEWARESHELARRFAYRHEGGSEIAAVMTWRISTSSELAQLRSRGSSRGA